jgi:hypothetical protein
MSRAAGAGYCAARPATLQYRDVGPPNYVELDQFLAELP